MGEQIYKKLESSEVRGVCVKCGLNPQSHKGYGRFRPLCNGCHAEKYPATRAYQRAYMAERRKAEGYLQDEKSKRQRVGYKAFKKGHCESCGFVAVESCQLDVDHVDGNKANNNPLNYQTLCANCHRLKTHLAKNFKPRKNT